MNAESIRTAAAAIAARLRAIAPTTEHDANDDLAAALGDMDELAADPTAFGDDLASAANAISMAAEHSAEWTTDGCEDAECTAAAESIA